MDINLDSPRSKAWRLFITTHAQLIELIERELTEAGMPPLGWYDVLLALEEAPDHKLRMHELANAIILSRSNLTRLVDRLEGAKLLCRQTCPTDRRGSFAAITAEGLAMRRQMWPIYAQGIAKYFAQYLNDTEVNVLTEAFQKVLTSVREPQKQ